MQIHPGPWRSALGDLFGRNLRNDTTNLRYDQDRAGAAVPAPAACTQDITAYYTLSHASAATATTYALRAVPIGDQASDKCGTLTLSHTGARGQAAGVTDCWK